MNYYPHPQTGLLRVAGPDQVDFLQRQTSNDMRLLTDSRALPTVLTSPTARILDVFYFVLETGSEGKGIRAISLTGNGSGMAKYFKSRIFFMDKVSVENISDQYAQFSLFGEQAGEALQTLGLGDLPEPGDFQRVEFQANAVTVLRHHPSLGRGYLALVPQNLAEAFQGWLNEAGFACLDAGSYEVFRIENGLPAGKHELTEDFTPFEVGLSSLVSTAKGCFTGQEILARQVTYDKIVRSLAGLKSDTEIPAGTQLKQDGKPAGTVTSSVISPRLGPIALAVLRRPYQEPGTVLQAAIGSETIRAVVHPLPLA